MDLRFNPHNTHLEYPGSFSDRDPHLRQLKQQVWIHRSDLLDRLPAKTPGIYTLSGSRQIGKSTITKQWMAELLAKGVQPDRIAYLTGELIDDHHSLVRLMTDTLDEMPLSDLRYLIIDEITYVRDWDKGVKYLADSGILENVAVILTGSDLVIIKEARMRFPGRRGTSETVDFHLYPLSFHEAVKLKTKISRNAMEKLIQPVIEPDSSSIDILYQEFEQYLVHGGFLTAINDMAKNNRISPSTFATYSDWIRGDVLKKGKQERYLQEILGAIIKRYGSQVTWNALSRDLSIDHPKTVADYIDLLASMDAVFVQSAILEKSLAAAPKKARKLMFTDPFIYHAASAWLKPRKDPYHHHVTPAVADPSVVAKLTEACVITHYRRYYPTYYIKAAGEVDIAYVDENRFHPVEIKWTSQIRSNDLKQIARYPNGRILTKARQSRVIKSTPTEPLPLALLRLSSKSTPNNT
jgi:predicted AAA+ superfamily ATPase